MLIKKVKELFFCISQSCQVSSPCKLHSFSDVIPKRERFYLAALSQRCLDFWVESLLKNEF